MQDTNPRSSTVQQTESAIGEIEVGGKLSEVLGGPVETLTPGATDFKTRENRELITKSERFKRIAFWYVVTTGQTATSSQSRSAHVSRFHSEDTDRRAALSSAIELRLALTLVTTTSAPFAELLAELPSSAASEPFVNRPTPCRPPAQTNAA